MYDSFRAKISITKFLIMYYNKNIVSFVLLNNTRRWGFPLNCASSTKYSFN